MRGLLPFAFCIASPLLVAQTPKTFVLPQGADTMLTTNNDQSYFGIGGTNYNGTTTYVPIHVQNGFATADMPTPVGIVSAIAMRRNNYYGNNMYPSATDLTVYISTTASAPSAYTSTFASNEGGNRAQVFGSGGNPATLNWPGLAQGTGIAPFIFKIPFTQPFVLLQNSGAGITIDYYITKRSSPYTSGSNTYEANLFMDAAATTTGLRASNGAVPSNCKFSNSNYNSSLSYTTGGLTSNGGTWYVSYGNIPTGTVGVAALSAQGVPNTPLFPFDLTPFGAPGCTWQVGLEFGFVALTASGTSLRWPNITIPAGLTGVKFYDQGLFVDLAANPLGLVTSWSSEWTIVKAYTPDCVTIYKTQDSTPPATTGSVRRPFAVVTQFEYQ